MERKKVTPEVATPRSSWETAFCTTTTRTWMTRPSPAPKTKKQTLIDQVELVSDRLWRRSRPSPVRAVPTIGKTFQRPVRETIWPETVEVSSTPRTIGSMWTPDMVADALDVLQIGRQEGHRAEHGEADDEAEHGDETVKIGVPEQLACGSTGSASPGLDPAEPGPRAYETADDEPGDLTPEPHAHVVPPSEVARIRAAGRPTATSAMPSSR
ncbi:hypothetical protein STANM309S_04186 [Streptomyces tanashiensis]